MSTTTLSTLDTARLLVSGDKEASLETIALAYQAGATPLDLFTTDKPTSTMRGKAWGAYIVFKYPEIKVSHIVKNQNAIGKKSDLLDFNLSSDAMSASLTDLTDLVKRERAEAEADKVISGEALTSDLDALITLLDKVATNPIYPTIQNSLQFKKVSDQINALRGSFGLSDKIEIKQEEPSLV
jgi:hypothetical protein